MSECLDCGKEILNTKGITWCGECLVKHVFTEPVQGGCEDYGQPHEWKYCPHCGERLA